MTWTGLDLERRVADLVPGLVADLERLVRIPSVAASGYPRAPLLEAAALVARLLREAGADEVAELDVPGSTAPVVVARVAGPPGAPTVLVHSHYDVVPAGDADLWRTPAFEPVVRDGAVWGRGTADAKAEVMGTIGALRAYGGAPPVGLTLVVEGQEEVGSPFLDPTAIAASTVSTAGRTPVAAAELLAADVVVVADVAGVRARPPTLTVSLRGAASVDVEVRTLVADQHSGQFGGAAPDARLVLLHALATLHDEHGDVAVAGLRREPWSGAGWSEAEFRRLAGVEPGLPLLGTGDLGSRLWTGPAVTVVGLDGPPVDEPVGAVAGSARATLELRTHPAQDPAQAQAALIAHLAAVRPFGVPVVATAGAPALGHGFRASTSGPAFAAARSALTQAWGAPVVEVGGGGAVPLVSALAAAAPGAEVLLVGLTGGASNVHGADEHVLLAEFERSVLAKALFLRELADRWPAGHGARGPTDREESAAG